MDTDSFSTALQKCGVRYHGSIVMSQSERYPERRGKSPQNEVQTGSFEKSSNEPKGRALPVEHWKVCDRK
ncbi:hypothetical protein TNCV_1764341 [Trichonephila clavipes]|nr:hypothetical protein TNCV_1764341 [Trichonephila clavipes]